MTYYEIMRLLLSGKATCNETGTSKTFHYEGKTYVYKWSSPCILTREPGYWYIIGAWDTNEYESL